MKREKYRVKNKTRYGVERCNIRWKAEEEKVVELNDKQLFQVKACVYLEVSPYENRVLTVPKDLTPQEKLSQEINPQGVLKLVCPVCGKSYQNNDRGQKYYNLHIAKCQS